MRTNRNISIKKSAFTLVELLVVIAIIGILLGILIPVLSKVRERGRVAVCQSNIRQLCAAWSAYALDNDGEIVSPPWYDPFGKQRSLKDYVKGSHVELCPSDPANKISSYGLNDYLNMGYGVNIPPAKNLSKISKPSQTF